MFLVFGNGLNIQFSVVSHELYSQIRDILISYLSVFTIIIQSVRTSVIILKRSDALQGAEGNVFMLCLELTSLNVQQFANERCNSE